MKYADEINEIACKWAEMAFDIPDSVHVSSDIYREIVSELEVAEMYPRIEFHSQFGCHKIIVQKDLPPKTIHMNRLTLNDVLVDDILLDDDSLDFLDD